MSTYILSGAGASSGGRGTTNGSYPLAGNNGTTNYYGPLHYSGDGGSGWYIYYQSGQWNIGRTANGDGTGGAAEQPQFNSNGGGNSSDPTSFPYQPSAASGGVPVLTLAAPPVPIAPAAPTITGIGANGSAGNPGALTTNATSCNLQVTLAADTGFASVAQTLTGATPSSAANLFSGLSPNVNYIYRTQMVGAGGTTSGPATAVTPTLPAAPTSLIVAAVQNTTQLSLSWTVSPGNATSPTYNVLRSTVNGSGYSQVATGVGTNSWTDNTGLAGNTNYYYTVQEVNASGASASSIQGIGITLTCPAVPTGLTGTPSVSGTPQVALSWSSVSGATGYNIYRSGTLGGSYTLVSGGGNVTLPLFTDVSVADASPYYYKVSSLNATGESALSSASSQEFVGIPVTTVVTTASDTHGGILVSWTPPAGYTGTGFNVYRSTATQYNGVAQRNFNEQPYTFIPWGTTTFTDKKVGLPVISGGNVYTYYVATVNGTNESALSTASSPLTFTG